MPYLFVDVNIGDNEPVRIAVYEGDTAEELADEFDWVHWVTKDVKWKLVDLLKMQMSSVLEKIVEEEDSVNEV